MSQSAFEVLSLEEQISYLYQGGTLVFSSRNHLYQVLLFSLDTFFVELWAYGRTNQIGRVRTFSSFQDLAVYANLISLPALNH
jgi:hypothetical protein